MLKLYITRHGETEWNVAKKMQGWKDSGLTDKGIENAIALGNRLKDVKLKCIYSSPSGRAMQTSELIRGNRKLEIVTVDNLREIHLGDWEGKTSDEVEKIDSEGHKVFWGSPHLYVPKSGESFFDVRERVTNTINNIIKENESGEVLIVTHAIVVKTIMAIFKNLDVEKLWEQPFIHGTSLSIVEVDKESLRVILEGDLTHINKN